MKAIQIISQDVFDKVRSRFQNLEMGDETGAVTLDPAQARFFDFDFIYEGANLGRVSISLADLGSLKIYYSQGITEDQDDTSKKIWYNFLREMRQFAMRRLLRFDTRDIAKTNLDKNDFQHLAASQKPKEQDAMSQTMNESRWTKRTAKTSRVVKDGTQVIVRYKESMEEAHPSQLGRPKYIEGIFVQNNAGERFKCPFNDLDTALALGMHVSNGGVPHDPLGIRIIKLAETIYKLQEFQKKVQKATLHPDATKIQEKAISHLSELRQHLRSLSKRRGYKAWVESLTDDQPSSESDVILDQVTLEDYKAKFTQTNFIEGLEEYFPLIHKIMQEANTVDLEEYVKEENKDDTSNTPSSDEVKKKMARVRALAKKGIPTAEDFEEWAESLVEDEDQYPSPDQIKDLKDKLADPNFKLTDNSAAYDFFAGNGFVSDELERRFEEAAQSEYPAEPLTVFKNWLEETNDTLFKELNDVLPAEEPTEPEAQSTQEPQQPETPVSEPQAPQEPTKETTIPPVRGTATVHGIMPAENTEMTMPPGVMMETDDKKITDEITKHLMTQFNKDNPTIGPFKGEATLTAVVKAIKEKFGKSMDDKELEKLEIKTRKIARQIMKGCSRLWLKKKNHKEELNRIRHLSGLKK